MHFGVDVQHSGHDVIHNNPNATHLIFQVDEELLNELEEAFTINNAEEIGSDNEPEEQPEIDIQAEHKEATPTCPSHAKYAAHFTCELRSDCLKWLADGIAAYSSYFSSLRISISSEMMVHSTNSMVATHNFSPQQIAAHIEEFKRSIMNSQLSLNSFGLYINIAADLYHFVYPQLLRLMDDRTICKFMNFNPYTQTLAFTIGLSEQNMESAVDAQIDSQWSVLREFLSRSQYIHNTELVVKTQSLYTHSAFHGAMFNQLLDSIECNKNKHVIDRLKLTCWGFMNSCSEQIQSQFAKHVQNIIVEHELSKLWLRYAGMNEFILNHVFDGIQHNTNFTELTVQRMLLTEQGKCLSKLGKIVSTHIGIESVQIGWNMASVADTKYYTDLLHGIAANCGNLSQLELYADTENKLKVLDVILKRNTILRDIRLNIMNWCPTEDNLGNDIGCTDNQLIAMCDELINVMIHNQLYLQSQMEAIQLQLKAQCGFPHSLTWDVLQYVYSLQNSNEEEWSLSVELVMDCNDETPEIIMASFKQKVDQLNEVLNTKLVKRSMRLKLSKHWPG